MWYVLYLYDELDKFLTRLKTLPAASRRLIQELVTFRRPERGMYQKDLGLFVGYVFVQVDPSHIADVDRLLQDAEIGRVLGNSGPGRYVPLGPDEHQWILDKMSAAVDVPFKRGHKVRITAGPFEGMYGVVDDVTGQVISVRVPLQNSTSTALCAIDDVEAA